MLENREFLSLKKKNSNGNCFVKAVYEKTKTLP